MRAASVGQPCTVGSSCRLLTGRRPPHSRSAVSIQVKSNIWPAHCEQDHMRLQFLLAENKVEQCAACQVTMSWDSCSQPACCILHCNHCMLHADPTAEEEGMVSQAVRGPAEEQAPSIMRQTEAALGLWEQLHVTASTPSTVLPPQSVRARATGAISASTDQSAA